MTARELRLFKDNLFDPDAARYGYSDVPEGYDDTTERLWRLGQT